MHKRGALSLQDTRINGPVRQPNMQNWERRIHAVLGDDCARSPENACRYRAYLKEHLALPVRVTGIEDFPWEEPYVLGGLDKKEYEELKKTNPSFTDKFDLLDILDPEENDDLVAVIRRVSDGQTFQMGLSWLKCTDRKCSAYVTLNDYSLWHANYE
jgi:hypothetical protein